MSKPVTMTENRLTIRRAFLDGKINAVCGYPGIGKTQEVMGSDGRLYAVKTLKNGYEITNPEGEKMTLTYNKKTKTWSERVITE